MAKNKEDDLNYSIRFAGREQDAVRVECPDINTARNLAIKQLGGYLIEHPGFADEGHWRVEIENEVGQTVSTIIVATVTPRRTATAG